MKEKRLSLSNKERAEEWMQLLSRESPEIRNEIANDFPSYNSLLCLHAKSFEEFALLPIARAQGLPYADPLFDYRCIKPPCPHCSSCSHVQRKGKGTYLCRACNKKFTANANSISSGFRQPSVVWRKVLHCMLNLCSIKQACDYCAITPTTYYNIRTRIFYAMQLMMEDVRLYGAIQVDNTFVRLSFKGSELNTDEYPKDSPFACLELAPRNARVRGGSYKQSERHKNAVCIFAAIDDVGHVMVRLIGTGAATARKLLATVGTNKFLQTVPEKDPFDLMVRKNARGCDKVGAASFVIADGERAIKKYADVIGICCETNVYRRHGRQIRLGNNTHDIQRVNSLHSRLKAYLRKLNYVSSKYLPGFFALFEFLENTGATDEAIGRLFEILATPGLGKDANFFDKLFTAPAASKKGVIRAFGESDVTKVKDAKPFTNKQMLAIYLYDAWKNGQIEAFSSAFLEKCTGVSLKRVERLHSIADADGRIDNIRTFKMRFMELNVIPSDILLFYDRLAEMRQLPKEEQVELKDFIAATNIAYQTNYSRGAIRRYIKLIALVGWRDPIPEPRGRRVSEHELCEKYRYFYRERQKRYSERRANNENVTFGQIENDMSLEYGIPVTSLKYMIQRGARLEKEAKKKT